jgi:hypothetical protein
LTEQLTGLMDTNLETFHSSRWKSAISLRGLMFSSWLASAPFIGRLLPDDHYEVAPLPRESLDRNLNTRLRSCFVSASYLLQRNVAPSPLIYSLLPTTGQLAISALSTAFLGLIISYNTNILHYHLRSRRHHPFALAPNGGLRPWNTVTVSRAGGCLRPSPSQTPCQNTIPLGTGERVLNHSRLVNPKERRRRHCRRFS